MAGTELATKERRVANGSDFERGEKAGAVDATLSEHGRRLDKINGSMQDVARELHAVNLTLQRLEDQAAASINAAKVVASALKDADAEREEQEAAIFQPWQRLALILGAVGASLTIVTFIILRFNG